MRNGLAVSASDTAMPAKKNGGISSRIIFDQTKMSVPVPNTIATEASSKPVQISSASA